MRCLIAPRWDQRGSPRDDSGRCSGTADVYRPREQTGQPHHVPNSDPDRAEVRSASPTQPHRIWLCSAVSCPSGRPTEPKASGTRPRSAVVVAVWRVHERGAGFLPIVEHRPPREEHAAAATRLSGTRPSLLTDQAGTLAGSTASAITDAFRRWFKVHELRLETERVLPAEPSCTTREPTVSAIG